MGIIRKGSMKKCVAFVLTAVLILQSVISHVKVSADDSVYLEITGYQISTTLGAYRTLYSIADPSGKTEEVGLVYGLTDYVTESEMIVGSSNSTVYSFAATSVGKLDTNYSENADATTYVRTMELIKSAEFYNADLSIRAYAKLTDGSYVYSDINVISVYEIADILYQNSLMNNVTGHNYLYNNILSIANTSYEPVTYDENKVIVPSETTTTVEETTATGISPESVDWSSISYLTGTSEEQYKVYVVSGVKEVVNVQQPGFATAVGIYMTFDDADLGNATVNGNELSKDVQGAGILAHLSNFESMYNTVVIYNSDGTEKAVFFVYNAKAEETETTTTVETTTVTAETTTSAEETTKNVDDGVPYITITNGDGSEVDSSSVTYDKSSTPKVLTIKTAGTYILSGGTTDNPVTNTEIVVAKSLTDEVNLIWDNIVIDNSALGTNDGEDVPVFSIGKSTTNVNVTLKGKNVLTGNGSFASEPAAVISANDTSTTLTFASYNNDNSASLTVTDSMSKDTDFGDCDPSDGIYCKGTLIMDSGVYNVTANGDALKGTGKSGAGGIVINGGDYTLKSNLSNALKSKNGNITITGGTINSSYTKDDSINAKNYDVIISGGNITIDNCYGDGIQGENVKISGDSTVLSITTYFENAGKNYYNSELGTGNYNTMTVGTSSKTEVVNVDTGSHKGIKGGTKASTYVYNSVEDGSDYVAGTTYTQEASGGIEISGGTITIDTTNAGIKYNGGSSMGGAPGQNQGTSSSGNISAANNDGQYIIGAPDDGIHSNNTCTISGGNIDIASSDDGITSPTSLTFTGDCDVKISTCYEGIEGGQIVVGSSTDSSAVPNIKVYSNDDGVNASSKTVSYVYVDESEEQYTKTENSTSNNDLKVYSGYLNIMIGDDETHSFSLPMEDGTVATSTYSSNGDGIDCNGSFYAYGGTIIVYGANSNDNSPIDTDSTYYVGSGVTILAVGAGMTTSPTSKQQPVVTNSSSSGGMGNMGGMNRPGQSGSSSSTSASAFAIYDSSNNMLVSVKPTKSYSYILYTSPSLSSGSSYTLYTGGSVSGSLINSDTEAYDYRYSGYNTSGATSSTITAN